MRNYIIVLFLSMMSAAAGFGGIAFYRDKISASAELAALRLVVRADFASAVSKQLATEATVPLGATLLFGDSLVANLPLRRVSSPVINYGIPGAVTTVVLHRIQLSRALSSARVVVVQGGVNDLGLGPEADALIEKNMRHVLALVPQSVPVILLGILPVAESKDTQFKGYNARARQVNEALAELCATSVACRFLDLSSQFADAKGNLRDDLRTDSVHYNEKGGELIAAAIAAAI